jgi:hypothetical protein
MAEKVKPFEKIFPYISYRWKYDDGEYSPYAPFTEVQFISKPIESINDRYEKGFNVFMVNDVENIVLNNIPKGREDVIAIDILYTESISSTVYILKTIEIDAADRGNGFLNGIIISKRALGIALPNNELSRQFDAVPLKAKSQEFTANRLIYGNYVTKFNQGKNDLGGDGLQIKIDTVGVVDPVSGPSVKTNRTYDVGVVYMDKYGRQGGILSQKTGNNSENSSLIKTDFTYSSRVKLTSKISSQPPVWASAYKYYVKDVSTDFYNMTAFNSYLDGEPGDTETANIYLQFDSKDRNKITEDSFLIPKRDGFATSAGNTITELSRIPVLDIENEAPDIVKAQIIERAAIKKFTIRDDKAQIITSYSDLSNALTPVNPNSANNQVFYIKDSLGVTWDTQYIITQLNQYITSQSGSTTFDSKESPYTSLQTIDFTGFNERLALQFVQVDGIESKKILIDEMEFGTGGDVEQRNIFKITLSNQLNDQDQIISTKGIDVAPAGGWNFQTDVDIKFFKLGLSEAGQKKLKGSFFVKVPKKTGITSFPNLPIGQTELDEEGKLETLKFFDFETEPGDDSNLDLYWEASSMFPISDHGLTNIIDWSNCIATVGGTNNKIYLESINIQDKFNSTSLVKGIRVNTPEANYSEEYRKYGLIFSGLYNSRTGINELNRFSLADGITKELEPNYGGIQKLHALDTNLLAFTEDKVFRILADKDALFNADEGVNVTATNLVLGQAMVYQGNYGISTHPESFAYFGNNIYFTDAKRGVVMQLTPANGQLFPISSNGMSNFFRDRIGIADKLIGAYDGAKKLYVISMQGYNELDPAIGSETLLNETSNATLGYSLKGQYWTSRYSFIPESGLTLNNKFYTFKNGKIYLHNSDTSGRNNFYGVQYNSEVEVIFNDNPTYISDYLSMNYEGSQDWEVVSILADQEENIVTDARIMDNLWFFKEGKYHAAIVGTVPVFIVEPGSSPNADGFYPLIQDTNNTQDVAGVKGFFAKVRLRNPDTDKRELFAITTEYYISQT